MFPYVGKNYGNRSSSYFCIRQLSKEREEGWGEVQLKNAAQQSVRCKKNIISFQIFQFHSSFLHQIFVCDVDDRNTWKTSTTRASTASTNLSSVRPEVVEIPNVEVCYG